MLKMQALRVFLNDRLTAVAEEIFEVVERTIAEFNEEICRSKDLEICRLRMQLKRLKSESASDTFSEAPEELQHPAHHDQSHSPPTADQEQLHESSPGVAAPESQHSEEDGDSSMDQEHPETSQEVRNDLHLKSHSHFWMDHNAEHVDDLEPDVKDFISSPSEMKPDLHDEALHFQHYINSSGEESRDKPYSCSVCDKRFSNCSHLAAHIRTHTGERPYMCDICKKTFITTSALNRHQTIHTEGKRYVCGCCGKSFKWMESLGRHMRSAHKKDTIPEHGLQD